MDKQNRVTTGILWGILLVAGLVLAGIELLSGERHWSVVPTGKGAIDQAISPDETLLVVLNAGENSLSFIDLKSKIPFNKLYLPLEALKPGAEGEEPRYILESLKFSGDGSKLFVTSSDTRYFVIDPVLVSVLSSGELLEPGLHLLEKGGLEDGALAVDAGLGKLSLLSEAGELPMLVLGSPLASIGIDIHKKAGCGSCKGFALSFAFQARDSSRLNLLGLDSGSLEVKDELGAVLPEGAIVGDIQRGEEGYLLGVSFAKGGYNLLWLNPDGTLKAGDEEPIEGAEGGKIWSLCQSGIYIAHLGSGSFTLATYDKEGQPLRLDLRPCGFDGVLVRSMSAYPEQADSFASAVGPHEAMFGVAGWEGAVVFDSSGQMILGYGNNNNHGCFVDCSATCHDPQVPAA